MLISGILELVACRCTLPRQHHLGPQLTLARRRDRQKPVVDRQADRPIGAGFVAGREPDPVHDLARLLGAQRPLRQVRDQLLDRPDPIAGIGQLQVPDRGAPQLGAVSVRQLFDQRPDVGAGRGLDLEPGEPSPGIGVEQLGAVDLDLPLRTLGALLPPMGALVEALAADPHRRGQRDTLNQPARGKREPRRHPAGLRQLALRIAGARAPAEPGGRQIGLREPEHVAL